MLPAMTRDEMTERELEGDSHQKPYDADYPGLLRGLERPYAGQDPDEYA